MLGTWIFGDAGCRQYRFGIVVEFMLLFHFRFKVEFGFGQLFVIIAGIYGIYLNLDALMKERKKKCENQTYS